MFPWTTTGVTFKDRPTLTFSMRLEELLVVGKTT